MNKPYDHRHLLRVLELCLAVSLTVWSCALFFMVMRNGGALWRDEVVVVNLARMPSWRSMLFHNYYEPLPCLFPVVLRSWTTMGLGQTDHDFRLLSMLLGMLVVGALWWTARRFGCRAPLLSLALFALSPAVFRFSNGVHPHLLGVITLLIALGVVWSLVCHPSPKRVLQACIAGIACVHTQYNNAPMLIAFCIAGAIACARRGQRMTIWRLLIIVVVAVFSLLPYVPIIGTFYRWSFARTIHIDSAVLAASFADAIRCLQPAGDIVVIIWCFLTLAAIGACSYRLNASNSRHVVASNPATFVLASLAAAFACLLACLKAMTMLSPVSPSYYLPILAVTAINIDVGVDLAVRNSELGRMMRLAFVTAIAIVTASGNWAATQTRFTNIDSIAGDLATRAAPGDFVIVSPWYLGVAFKRYYGGSAAWETLPELEDYLFLEYQALQDKMMAPDPIAGLLDTVDRTLRSGFAVWFVGRWVDQRPGHAPTYLEPSLDGGRTGSTEQDYLESWFQQLAVHLGNHARMGEVVRVNTGRASPLWEKAQLYHFNGWK